MLGKHSRCAARSKQQANAVTGLLAQAYPDENLAALRIAQAVSKTCRTDIPSFRVTSMTR